MAGKSVFEILSATVADGCAARLGRLSIPGRRELETPSYVAITSRGAIPHITPDNAMRHTNVNATYMALEDFIERKEPPVFNTPPHDKVGRLHRFTSTAPDRTVIFGARRCPPVLTPMGNGARSVTLFTSTGFANVNVAQYAAAVHQLQPDVVVPLADSLHTSSTPASRKLMKMVGRTEEWVDEFLQHMQSIERLEGDLRSAVFAPLLPVEFPLQWDYIRHLAEDVRGDITGLAIYDARLVPELKAYESLNSLARLSFDLPLSPHDVLRQVALGIDICALPFVNSATDAGIALTFTFPPSPDGQRPWPLGINMWSVEHRVAVVPLQDGCTCYACVNHHRAYVQHLLNAKEMLGWNLLQIHNHHVIDRFFESIKATLRAGLPAFERGSADFVAAYDPELPQGTGERPRARGYHFKSEAGQDKINKAAWVADFQDGPLNAEVVNVNEEDTP